jgi:hemolysin D
MARTLDVARLDSLLAGGPSAAHLQVPVNADPVLTEAAQRLLDSQWHERTAKLASLDGEIERRAADISVAKADIGRFEAIIPLLRDRSDSLAGLALKGFTSRIHASEVQQQLIEAEKGLIGAMDKRTQAEAALRAAEQQRVQTERETETGARSAPRRSTSALSPNRKS